MIALKIPAKNQCFSTTDSSSKKKMAPTLAWFKKSEARKAIHLNIWKPASDLRTKRAMACWKKRPTMTVCL